jgi:hypothetical protein
VPVYTALQEDGEEDVSNYLKILMKREGIGI